MMYYHRPNKLRTRMYENSKCPGARIGPENKKEKEIMEFALSRNVIYILLRVAWSRSLILMSLTFF